MNGLLNDERVGRVRADQCRYGAKVRFGRFVGTSIMKPTGFMSNSQEILNMLTLRCLGDHEHAVCSGRVAKEAAQYPQGLVKAIIKGMVRQMKKDGNIIEGCVGIQPVFEILKVEAPVNEALVTGKFKDDITGQLLNDALVEEARAKEMTYFASRGFWITKHRAEAFEKTGRPPISVRWVVVNNGDGECPK